MSISEKERRSLLSEGWTEEDIDQAIRTLAGSKIGIRTYLGARGEYSDEVLLRGYDIFSSMGSASVIPQALHIEKIDVVELFGGDFEAARQAEADGFCTFINDVEGLERGTYIDTPENRAHCTAYIEKHPEYRIENQLNSKSCSRSFAVKYRRYCASLE